MDSARPCAKSNRSRSGPTGQPRGLNKTDITPSAVNQGKYIQASIKNDQGIDEILAKLTEFAEQFFSKATTSPLITSHRHREHLMKCSKCLKTINFDRGVEFAAEDLRMAAAHLGRITGKIDIEEMLDKIFSSFCIGK